MLSTVTLIGAVFGGIFFGIAADKYGRVRVFSWTIIIFSIFTGLCALSSSYEAFMLFRFLSGLGLGGEFGIGMTLVAETWPKQYRSRVTSVVALGFQVGIILATLTVFLIGGGKASFVLVYRLLFLLLGPVKIYKNPHMAKIKTK